MKLTEYDISFATKEYLLDKGCKIVTWNPPGSQGTFTIPNPAKDPANKGQDGSESPDLIAYNDTEIFFVEAKDSAAKSLTDIDKLRKLLNDSKRKGLLYQICTKQMQALGNVIHLENLIVRLGIAIPQEENIISSYKSQSNLTLFLVSSNRIKWNNKKIDASTDIKKVFNVFEKII